MHTVFQNFQFTELNTENLQKSSADVSEVKLQFWKHWIVVFVKEKKKTKKEAILGAFCSTIIHPYICYIDSGNFFFLKQSLYC